MLSRSQALRSLCQALSQRSAPQLISSAFPADAAASGPTAGSCSPQPGLSHILFRAFAQPAVFDDTGRFPGAGDLSFTTAESLGFAGDQSLPLETRPFLSTSRRTGVIAVKVGMTQEWDQWKVRHPVTILWIDDCQVVQQKLQQRDGYTALQLGCGAKREKNVHFGQIGHCRSAGVPLKRKYAEFRVTEDAMLPVGTHVGAAHFVPGQYLDITGTTIGKGFQGVMKRWGFSGQPASHGNSLAHRAAGSISGGQDPGRVFKGHPMAGRMGNRRRTASCVWLYKVDPARNLLYVKGSIPGHKGNFLLVKDAILKKFEKQPPRPFPTFIGEPGDDVITAPAAAQDPYLQS